MARKLEVEIVGDASSLHRALNQSSTSTGKFGGVLNKLKYAAVGAGAAIGTGLVVGVEKSIHAAIDAQAVNARLGVAFKNAGLDASKYKDQIDKLEGGSRKLGFTDDDVANSLGSLITATGNYAKAAKDVGVAQDIARFKSVSLNDATKMLTMAMTGSQRAAKQLGITVSPVTANLDKLKASNIDLTTASGKAAEAQAKLQDKFATGQAVIDAVTKKVHGQADAYASTAAGAMEQFRAQLNHIEIEIGNKLLPIMVTSIKYITTHWPEISATVTRSWQEMRPSLVAFGQTVAELKNIVQRNWDIIGPIWREGGRVVVAIVANMTFAIRVLAQLLRGDWGAAWNEAKKTASADAAAIGGAIRLPFQAAEGAIQSVIGALSRFGGAIGHKFTIGLDSVIGAFQTLYGWIMRVINAIKSIPHDVSVHVHIPGAGLLHKIPGLASGGNVVKSGLAMVGERGPELLSLPGGASVTPLGAGGRDGSQIVQLVLDGKVLAELLLDPMRGQAQIYKQRTGRAPFPA